MASEYGWSKDAICQEVYPDDLFFLQQKIINRQLSQYLMELNIATNPHLKPEAQQKLYDRIGKLHRQINGEQESKLDREGLRQLKEQLRNESKMISVR